MKFHPVCNIFGRTDLHIKYALEVPTQKGGQKGLVLWFVPFTEKYVMKSRLFFFFFFFFNSQMFVKFR